MTCQSKPSFILYLNNAVKTVSVSKRLFKEGKLKIWQYLLLIVRWLIRNSTLYYFCILIVRRLFMITEEVGKRIKYLRQEKRLSQEKLALKAGIDRTYLAGIESGKRNATITSLAKVVKALDITMAEFFDFEFIVDYEQHV